MSTNDEADSVSLPSSPLAQQDYDQSTFHEIEVDTPLPNGKVAVGSSSESAFIYYSAIEYSN